jgi:hypothetical protein
MHEDIWQKWREADKPKDWKIMTKVEHTQRTAEYVALLERQNPRGMRKNKINESELPAIARPAVLPMAVEIAPAADEQPVKHKRKRRKPKKTGKPIGGDDADADDAEGAPDEPSAKRRV